MSPAHAVIVSVLRSNKSPKCESESFLHCSVKCCQAQWDKSINILSARGCEKQHCSLWKALRSPDDLYEPSWIVFALKDSLCTMQHTCYHPLSSYSLEHIDNRNSSTSTRLLIGGNVVLATCRTGDRVGGSLEELPQRPSEHVWNVMYH